MVRIGARELASLEMASKSSRGPMLAPRGACPAVSNTRLIRIEFEVGVSAGLWTADASNLGVSGLE